MSTKPKSSDSISKSKGPESTWKKALIAKAEWPDKVKFKSRDFCDLYSNYAESGSIIS